MLADLERELGQLEERRDKLDRAIARLRRIAAWLRRRGRSRKASTDDEGSGPQSLTNSCRAVLRMSTPNGLTPQDVRRLLTESGFVWDRFTNPMAAIHTVLKRLVHQQEAVASIDRSGERRFAVRRTGIVALRRQDIDDEAFVRKLLEADSPETIAELVKRRRLETL
jgi:hypothetical protein